MNSVLGFWLFFIILRALLTNGATVDEVVDNTKHSTLFTPRPSFQTVLSQRNVPHVDVPRVVSPIVPVLSNAFVLLLYISGSALASSIIPSNAVPVYLCLSADFHRCTSVSEAVKKRKRKFLEKFMVSRNLLCELFTDKATSELSLHT